METVVDVVVVGSGIAGLYAAWLLKQRNASLKVVVLEAGDYIGGRIKQATIKGCSRQVDMGAEFVHGTRHELMNIVKKLNLTYSYTHTLGSGSGAGEMYFIGRERKMVPFNSGIDKDITKLEHVLQQTDLSSVPSDNTSVHEYLASKGVPYRVMGLADTLIGKYYGVEIDLLSVREYALEEHEYDVLQVGPENYRLDGTYSNIIKYFAEAAGTGWQVKKIDYTTDIIKISGNENEMIHTKSVVVTVPMSVFCDIVYEPPLPPSKINAAKSMKITPAMKVILKFSTRFWPANHKLVMCGDCMFPHVWMHHLPELQTIVVAFVCGTSAATLSTLPQKFIVDSLLKQLDWMYGHTQDPCPASKLYEPGSVVIQDWTQQPFIKGGYTGPVNGAYHFREILAEPIENRIFFSGEAMSKAQSGTVSGAIESSLNAVTKLLTPKAKL